MAALARWGLAARGLVYLLIGWLAIQIALGHANHQANQRGAFAELASQPLGTVLLWMLAIGLTGYALWRLAEAAFGSASEGRKTGARLKSLVRGIVYAGFAASAFAFLAGNPGKSQKQKQQSVTAEVLHHSFGQVLVGLAGAVAVAVGIAFVVEGVKRKFLRELQLDRVSGATRTAVIRLGMAGTIARGVVFGIAGILIIDAAITFDPKKSSGLDGALRTLAQNGWGAALLWLLALGLLAFGLYGFAVAKWGKVRPGDTRTYQGKQFTASNG
jgi:hypothetical protein